jgi:CubicO group peptidase (beta-lactamase class C family)
MAEMGAKGLAYARVEGGEVTAVETFGARNEAGEPLTPNTVMYGASLTKAAFAYLVLQLADEGLLDLDQTIDTLLPKPLPEYVGFERTYAPWEDLADDPRWREITPRHLLGNAGGFRNLYFITLDGRLDWEAPLEIHFDPGSRYGYSGDGSILMQFVLEQGLGLDVGEEMRRRVFGPLGMTRTDMMWREDFAENLADGWTLSGEAVPHDERSKVRAAGSMDTTITDAAALFAAMVRCERLSERMCRELTAPVVPITTRAQFPAPGEELPEEERLDGFSSGPGIHLVEGPQGLIFWRGGHNEWTANMVVCKTDAEDCIVMLSNDVRIEPAYPMLVRKALGETGIPWGWTYSGMELLP